MEEDVVVPITFLSRSPGSSLFTFVGDLGVDVLKNGEFEGVRRNDWWFILDLTCDAVYYARGFEADVDLETFVSLLAEHFKIS